MIRPVLAAAAALALACIPAEAAERAVAAAAAPRPNVIVLMTDDQTVETLRVMPNVRRLIGDEGVTFDASYVSFSLCCPSRATFLTGQYAHNHGVLSNRPPDGGYYKLDSANTLPVWLQRSGYETVLVGKYLNAYGYLNPIEVPPGWSEWRATVDPSSYNYFNYTLNEGGTLIRFLDLPWQYQTDVIGERAVEIVQRRAPEAAPYFLWVSFLAPHANAMEGQPPPPGRPFGVPVPAPRHDGAFAGEPLPTPPSFNEPDVSDKPAAIRALAGIDERLAGFMQENYRRRLESLLAVDEAVAKIVDAAARSGELANTLIVFTSDNGYLIGEHRIPNGKVLPYEPSVRVPLLVRGPGIPRGRRLGQPVWNGDLPATILDLAQASPGRPQDGRSLVPLFRDQERDWGRDLLLESLSGEGRQSRYTAIHTPWYMYAEYATGDRELYDLRGDPDQLDSLHDSVSLAPVRDELARRLRALRPCAAAGCLAAPALRVDVGFRRGPAGCARGPVTVRVAGADTRWLLRVTFAVDRRGQALATAPPFSGRISPAAFRRGRPSLVRARAVLVDGRTLTLDRRLTRCAA